MTTAQTKEQINERLYNTLLDIARDAAKIHTVPFNQANHTEYYILRYIEQNQLIEAHGYTTQELRDVISICLDFTFMENSTLEWIPVFKRRLTYVNELLLEWDYFVGWYDSPDKQVMAVFLPIKLHPLMSLSQYAHNGISVDFNEPVISKTIQQRIVWLDRGFAHAVAIPRLSDRSIICSDQVFI
jgi:hypothetical protein